LRKHSVPNLLGRVSDCSAKILSKCPEDRKLWELGRKAGKRKGLVEGWQRVPPYKPSAATATSGCRFMLGTVALSEPGHKNASEFGRIT
jgi:hypothetical protein